MAEIALEQVPPGISFEQYLLALMRLNPALTGPGQPAPEDMKLPSAAQAGAVAPEQARVQLQAQLQQRRTGLSPALPAAAPAASSPTAAVPGETAPLPTGAASETGGEGSDVSSARPPPASSMPPAKASTADGRGLPIDPLMLIAVGAALLVILLLAFKRPESPQASAKQPPGPLPAPQRRRAEPEPLADLAQGRFRPALPPAEVPMAQRRPAAASPGLAGVALTQAPAQSAPPALTKLSDLGPLPSLDLDAPGPARVTPSNAGSPAPVMPGTQAPPAASAGPLDLSRISLDLDTPPQREP